MGHDGSEQRHYWITLQATDTNGNSEYNLDLVTVTGNCKPGRITSTVTDLVIPANGLPISIQRTYDSLNAAQWATSAMAGISAPT